MHEERRARHTQSQDGKGWGPMGNRPVRSTAHGGPLAVVDGVGARRVGGKGRLGSLKTGAGAREHRQRTKERQGQDKKVGSFYGWLEAIILRAPYCHR